MYTETFRESTDKQLLEMLKILKIYVDLGGLNSL